MSAVLALSLCAIAHGAPSAWAYIAFFAAPFVALALLVGAAVWAVVAIKRRKK